MPPEDGLPQGRRDQAFRRVAVLTIAVVVVLGLTGFLGVRTQKLATASGDVRAELTYPHVARPGLAVAWRVLVVSETGFHEPVTITIGGSYLDAFDQNGMTPMPDRIERDDHEVRFVFEAPPGASLELSVDMRLEPAVQWRQRGTTRVEIGAREVASWSYTTWVVP